MDDADVLVAQAFADVATIAILQHRASLEARVLNVQLQGALNSRITIEQAKGMLAERLGLDVEQAFVAIRRYARDHSLRLADVAHDLIARDPSRLRRSLRGNPQGNEREPTYCRPHNCPIGLSPLFGACAALDRTIWFNRQLGQPIARSLIAYDH
jgi:hypothetical protein